jgi:hypothetical protein
MCAASAQWLCRLWFFVWGGLPGGAGLPPAGHTQRNQVNPTAGGPRQSLTSEIRLTPLSQEVPRLWFSCVSKVPCGQRARLLPSYESCAAGLGAAPLGVVVRECCVFRHHSVARSHPSCEPRWSGRPSQKIWIGDASAMLPVLFGVLWFDPKYPES